MRQKARKERDAGRWSRQYVAGQRCVRSLGSVT